MGDAGGVLGNGRDWELWMERHAGASRQQTQPITARADPTNSPTVSGRLGDGMGDILGYARVSTNDQDVAGQTMRLTQAAAIKVFTDARSGRTMDRPGLDALLAYARKGDTLAVVRLDRLGRTLSELLATVAMLKDRGIAMLSLEEKIDTTSA